jgi:hypothetical protein
MKKTRVNINSIYDIIKLQRKYNMASNEKTSQTKIVLNICKFVNERVYFFKKSVMGICFWASFLFFAARSCQ